MRRTALTLTADEHIELGRRTRSQRSRAEDARRVQVILMLTVGEALLSHGFWTARFSGDASIVGRTVSVSGAVVTVVGVMPATFRFPAAATLSAASLQLATQPDVLRVAAPAMRLSVIGRLGPGIPADAAAHELLGIYRQAMDPLIALRSQ